MSDIERERRIANDVLDAQVRSYDRSVANLAASLRDLADQVERKAKPNVHHPQAYGDLAASVVHAVMWGVANANLNAIVTAACDADVAQAGLDQINALEAARG